MNIFPFSELRRRFMDNTMTQFTDRNYIERMFRFVAAMMMILFSLIPTYSAMIMGRYLQFPSKSSFCNFTPCFDFLWVVQFVVLGGPFFGEFSLLGFLISSYALYIFLGIFLTISLSAFDFNLSTFFTFVVFAKRYFSLVCFSIFSLVFSPFRSIFISASTFFAPRVMSVFGSRFFVKISGWFNSLAFRTLFCLNCLSHSLISSIKLWLEPVSGYNPFLARSILRGNASYVK